MANPSTDPGYGMVLCEDGKLRRVIPRASWWRRWWCGMKGHAGVTWIGEWIWVCESCGERCDVSK